MELDIPGYRIERKVGQGGMAIVYLAVQESLQRPVALKVLNPLFANTPEFTQRFLNEGRMLASVAHTNVITIHDIGVNGATHYIAMEYVEGEDLRRRMRGGLDVDTSVAYLRTLARALDFAHRRDIVHRDIKPSNVLFRQDGTLLLSDFGIAKLLGADSDLTVTGSAIGSPHYLSPEQARGKPVDARADIYSLGILFHEMLTGRKPFVGDSDLDTMLLHVSEPLPRLPEAIAAFQGLLDHMTAKRPAERPADIAATLTELDQAYDAWKGDPQAVDPTLAAAADRALSDAPTLATRAEVAPPVAPAGTEAPPRRAAPWRLLPAGLALLAVLGGGMWWLSGEGDEVVQAPAAGQGPTARADSPLAAPPAVVGAAPPSLQQPDASQSSAPAGVASGGEASTTAPSRAPLASGADGGERAPPGPAARQLDLAPAPSPGSATEPSDGAAAGPSNGSAAELADGASAGSADGGTVGGEATLPTATQEAAATGDDAERLGRLLEQADLAIEEFRLTTPAGNSALHYLEQMLEIDPANEAARASFRRIADRYVILARSQLRRGNPGRARLFVGRGLEVDGANGDLLALERELRTARDPAEAATSAPGASEPAQSGDESFGESPAELFQRIKRLFGN